jgi:hypothetical protein
MTRLNPYGMPIVAADVIISASPANAIWRGYWEA